MTPADTSDISSELNDFFKAQGYDKLTAIEKAVEAYRAQLSVALLEASDKPVGGRDDLIWFIHAQAAIPVEVCTLYVACCPPEFLEGDVQKNVARSLRAEKAFHQLEQKVTEATGLSLLDFGKSIFIESSTEQLGKVLTPMMLAGRSWKDLSTVVNNARRYLVQYSPEVRGHDYKARESSEWVTDWFITVLYSAETTDEAMSFLAKNAERFAMRNDPAGKQLERILNSYPTNPMIRPHWIVEGDTYKPVMLCRNRDKTLREQSYFGRLDMSLLAPILMRSALHFDDYRALDKLTNFHSHGRRVGESGIKKIVDEVLGYYRLYDKENPGFQLSKRWIAKTYGSSLSDYWNYLSEQGELFREGADLIQLPSWEELFRLELLAKAPAEFIFRLASEDGIKASAVNQFVYQMSKAGIDVYQGFLLMSFDRFQYEEKKAEPVDQDYMIRQSLFKIREPGYLGLLASVPVETILKYNKQPNLLLALYALTSDKSYVLEMSESDRGLAFTNEMGI